MNSSTPDPGTALPQPPVRRRLGRGQALVLFAMAITMLVGLMAIVIDVSWYWSNTLRVQRAADAAAMAGAVWLPGDPTTGITKAGLEATKNGYTVTAGTQCGVDRTCVVASPNPNNDDQMIVTISAPVQTFFMRVFGINTLKASRTAKAEYVLPVPMGSPLNYFGVYGKHRTPSAWSDWDSGRRFASATQGTVTWATPEYAFAAESPTPMYAWTGSSTNKQGYQMFNLAIRTDSGTPRFTNGGIQVFVKARSSLSTGCKVGIELSWDAGAHWTAQKTANLTGSDQWLTLGGNQATGGTDLANWWNSTSMNPSWAASEFSNVNFALRIQGGLGCGASVTYVDYVQVQVYYEVPDPNVDGPAQGTLTPQGSWAGMLSQGADMVNGDPYLSGVNGSGSNGSYKPYVSPYSWAPGATLTPYYDYAVEMAAGTTNGAVSIFDPVYCATDTEMKYGMGDHWYSGTNSVSAFYDIYDTNNTPYDLSDDIWIGATRAPRARATRCTACSARSARPIQHSSTHRLRRHRSAVARRASSTIRPAACTGTTAGGRSPLA